MSKEDFLLVFGFFGTGPIFTALAIFIDNIILKWIFGIVAFLGIALIVLFIVFFIIDKQKKKREPKSIYEYSILEKCPIDIEKTNQSYAVANHANEYSEREYCDFIDENNEYRFYTYLTYSDGSGGHVLMQEKEASSEVFYFGKSKKFNRLFNDFLFQVDETGESGAFGITARNILTGALIKCDWLSQRERYVSLNGFGRFYSQDIVNDVFVEGDKLIFKVTRLKCGGAGHTTLYYDENDIESKYTLVVKYAFGEFKVSRFFENN